MLCYIIFCYVILCVYFLDTYYDYICNIYIYVCVFCESEILSPICMCSLLIQE